MFAGLSVSSLCRQSLGTCLVPGPSWGDRDLGRNPALPWEAAGPGDGRHSKAVSMVEGMKTPRATVTHEHRNWRRAWRQEGRLEVEWCISGGIRGRSQITEGCECRVGSWLCPSSSGQLVKVSGTTKSAPHVRPRLLVGAGGAGVSWKHESRTPPILWKKTSPDLAGAARPAPDLHVTSVCRDCEGSACRLPSSLRSQHPS